MAASPPRKSHSERFVRETQGPALGTAPAGGPWGFHHHGTSRRQMPTSEHARFRAGNGEERGSDLARSQPRHAPAQEPQQHHICPASVRGPWSAIAVARCPVAGAPTTPHDPRRPRVDPCSMFRLAHAPLQKRRPSYPPVSRRRIGRGGETPPPLPFSSTHALGPGTGKSGGGPSTLATPSRSRSRAPAASRPPHFSQRPMVTSPPRKSHSKRFVSQTQGPALGTAPAGGPWGFRHHGTSRLQTPTSVHARFRAGNGEERGRTRRARNPTTHPLKSPQRHRIRPASVRGPWSRHRLENPTAKDLFARPGAQPSARRPPVARGDSVITGPRVARRPPARTHALGPGTGKSGGGSGALATPPRTRSRAPSRIASAPPQSGAHGRVTT